MEKNGKPAGTSQDHKQAQDGPAFPDQGQAFQHAQDELIEHVIRKTRAEKRARAEKV